MSVKNLLEIEKLIEESNKNRDALKLELIKNRNKYYYFEHHSGITNYNGFNIETFNELEDGEEYGVLFSSFRFFIPFNDDKKDFTLKEIDFVMNFSLIKENNKLAYIISPKDYMSIQISNLIGNNNVDLVMLHHEEIVREKFFNDDLKSFLKNKNINEKVLIKDIKFSDFFQSMVSKHIFDAIDNWVNIKNFNVGDEINNSNINIQLKEDHNDVINTNAKYLMKQFNKSLKNKSWKFKTLTINVDDFNELIEHIDKKEITIHKENLEVLLNKNKLITNKIQKEFIKI